MNKTLFYRLFFFTGTATSLQNAPAFSGKQIINITPVPGMDVGHTSDLKECWDI